MKRLLIITLLILIPGSSCFGETNPYDELSEAQKIFLNEEVKTLYIYRGLTFLGIGIMAYPLDVNSNLNTFFMPVSFALSS